MKHKEALETFTSDTFLNGYSDDIQEINKDTIKYIIDLIYEDFGNQICFNCKNLTKELLPFEDDIPSHMFGKCNVVGILYRRNVSAGFGCNEWEKE